VLCENCSTEYVYLLRREATGTGTSIYNLNNDGAENNAVSTANETIRYILENDFDPVPCPACGYYQRYMFPKLVETKGNWLRPAMLLVLLFGCLSGVLAIHRTIRYLQHSTGEGLREMLVAYSMLLSLCFVGLALSITNRIRTRRFDPNREDQHTRIAIGRSRALTRTEFEKAQAESRQQR
jgi:hypothetical protein